MYRWLTRTPTSFWVVMAGMIVGTLGACQEPSKQTQLKRARTAYLKAMGVQNEVRAMETFFQNRIQNSKRLSDVGLKSGGTSVDIPLMLALNGISFEELKVLQEKGFDFASALKPEGTSRPARRHAVQLTALQYELIVVGTIESVELSLRAPGHENPDGHGATFRVQIEKTLKGVAPDSTVTIRQISGRSEKGGSNVITHYGEITSVVKDNADIEGREYVFYLSNGLYDYLRSTRHGGQKMHSNYYRLGWARSRDIGKSSSRYAKEKKKDMEFALKNINEISSLMEEIRVR